MLYLSAIHTAAALKTSDPSVLKAQFISGLCFVDIDVLFDYWSNNDQIMRVRGEECVQM